MFRWIALVVMAAVVLALAAGTAVANDKSASKENNKGPQQVAAKTAVKDQTTDKGKNRGPEQVNYIFKGTIAQDGAEGNPLKVNVAKANKAGKSFVGKQLEFAVTPTTGIYLDYAEGQHPDELDAWLSDLRAGDKVVVQAKAPQGATSFTAGMISAEVTSTEAPSPSQ